MSKSHVTVIIPVYNSEQFLQTCLDSVYAQTYPDFDIIVVDDGSTDGSSVLLQKNASLHKNLQIIRQPNHGQGYARNVALSKASGEYVLFVDADDYIDEKLLEYTVGRARQDEADVVNYNWQILKNGQLKSTNVEPFASQKILRGDECEQYLCKNNYFSWDALYRKAFLQTHNIKFGEGYIYEDNEFIVQVASYAQTILLINEPLYTLRMDNESSTRTSVATNKHANDFIKAVHRSFGVLQPRSPYSSFYLAAYFLEKFIVYYQRRVPHQYLSKYLHDFLDVMHEQTIEAPAGYDYKFLRQCINHNIFAKKKYGLFQAGIIYKTKLLPLRSKLERS